MDALSLLKEACLKKSFKSFNHLQPGEYIVSLFEKYETDHGERVRITIDDFYMYLPERFNKSLSQEVIDDLNKSPKIMVYGGKDVGAQNRLILDFKDASYFTEMLGSEIFPVNEFIS